MKLNWSPEAKLEALLIIVFVPITTIIGAALTKSVLLGVLIGFAWAALQSMVLRMLIYIIKIIKDRKIIEPLREFVKNPGDTTGVVLSKAQYRKILESVTKPAKKKLNAICTISPSEFMAEEKKTYRRLQEKMQVNLQNKKRILVGSQKNLKSDPHLKDFVTWHLTTTEIELYWISKDSFVQTQTVFDMGADFPFSKPEDLVIFDRWLINGNREGESFRVNFCNKKHHLNQCQDFFEMFVSTDHKVTSYEDLIERLKDEST